MNVDDNIYVRIYSSTRYIRSHRIVFGIVCTLQGRLRLQALRSSQIKDRVCVEPGENYGKVRAPAAAAHHNGSTDESRIKAPACEGCLGPLFLKSRRSAVTELTQHGMESNEPEALRNEPEAMPAVLIAKPVARENFRHPAPYLECRLHPDEWTETPT